MPANAAETNSDNEDTLVWGAKAIGAGLNLSPRKAFYQLECGRIEGAFKFGNQWGRTPPEVAPNRHWGGLMIGPRHSEPRERGSANRVRGCMFA